MRPTVTVKPAASVEDQPIQIRVRGLSSHEVVSLELVSTDARGVGWVWRAKFVAGPSGVIDPARSAPRLGAYRGVWPMGLMSMTQPVGTAPAGGYFWAGNRPMRFKLTARHGSNTLASTTFTRRFSATTLVTTSQSLSKDGFVGQFTYPAGARRRPAIVVLSGSGGGLPGPLASAPPSGAWRITAQSPLASALFVELDS